MKSIILFAITIVAMVVAGCHSTSVSHRDLSFEAYCDSIWDADPDYYLDVFCTTDAYQDYVEANGRWWEE